jgi:hypothetical protein
MRVKCKLTNLTNMVLCVIVVVVVDAGCARPLNL